MDMKIVPVAKPLSFSEVKFTEGEWKAAVTAGPKIVPAVTALEAIQNGRGLYEIERKKVEAEVRVSGLTVGDLPSEQLKIIAAQMGKPIRKQISRKALVQFVEGLLSDVPVTDEADVEPDEGQD